MKNLNKFGVQELGTQEMRENNGGAEVHGLDGSEDYPFLLDEVVITANKPLGMIARERGYGWAGVLMGDILEGIARLFGK